nr:methyl-accepting chemotaxis protein [uncultured Duganella sp.]
MNALKKLKVGTQLSLGFGMVTALLLLLAAVSIFGVTSINDAFKQQEEINTGRLGPLVEAREALAQTGLAARNAFIFTDKVQAVKELAILDEQKAIYLKALEQMTTTYAGNVQFDKVRTGLLAMAQELNKPRKFRDADEMEAYGKFLVNECSPLRRQIVADMAVLLSAAQKEAAAASELSEQRAESARTWTITLAVTAFILSITISWAIKHVLLRQLGGEPAYATAIACKIANGDLAVTVNVKPGDQDSLLYEIKSMRDSLAAIVGKVREGTVEINTASSEIAAGNEDMSNRTAHQASSLEKIATAMEELTSTVRQNASNAQQANTLARTASSVSEKGGLVMQQVTDTMASINESSKKIVDIISVIDGIAFQTNILALNAAVEAARAGEQGRGFAVVATEVRNLAQRSASAAKEIKGLIDDSVTKVGSGSELVSKAGTTMQEVVTSVKRVTEIMSEISVASAEQTIGIEQVNGAIGEMDGMTQQNSALVEEASAAAHALDQQASALSEVVGVFKLESDSAMVHHLRNAPQRASQLKRVTSLRLTSMPT